MKNYFKNSSVKPGGSEYMVCSELMSRVDDLAPSDARVSAIIHRMANGMYHTLIPVRATAFANDNYANGEIYAEATTKSLISSLKQAQSEVLRKLGEWKSNRF